MAEYCTILMVDDKTSIGIGPVGTPVEATRRQKSVVNISNAEGLLACDHDHIPQNITPSVTLRIDPIDSNINWYAGSVTVCYKCAIFNASSAMLHAAEMCDKLSYSQNTNPFLYVLSDGGPDHKTTNISTHISFLALFLSLDLDGIIAARTPPYLSILNPCERVMPTINYALYGLALSQTRLDDTEHKLIRKLGSKSDWRKAQENEKHKPEAVKVDFERLAAKSLAGARDILTKRTEQMVFGGEYIKVVDPTPKERMTDLKSILKKYFTTIDFDKKLSKVDFLRQEEMKLFYENHVHELTYALQIKKCNNSSCKYHQPLRSEQNVFEKFVWIPPPSSCQTNFEKYEDFSVLIQNKGKPKEQERPGATKPETSNNLKRPNFKYINSKARACVRCIECGKGRLLYSDLTISRSSLNVFKDRQDQFTCGLDIFVGTPLEDVLFQHHNNSCSKIMTAAYFSVGPKLMNYLKMCSVCSELDEYCIEDPKYAGLPRCINCKADDKFYRHKNPTFKRKHK